MADQQQPTFSEQQFKMSKRKTGTKLGVLIFYLVLPPLGLCVFSYLSGVTFSLSQFVYLAVSTAIVLLVYVRGVGSWWGFLSAKELEGKDASLLERPLPQAATSAPSGEQTDEASTAAVKQDQPPPASS